MPEGDTIFRAAKNLDRALGGQTITGFRSQAPRFAFVDLTGRRIEEVEPRGKNILMHLDDGRILHSHMKMQGAWHLYRPGERWQRPNEEMRVVIETATFIAVCFSAPIIGLETRESLARSRLLTDLGPDLLDPGFELDVAEERLREQPKLEIAVALLRQDLVAGLGNVYKSEVLFIERQSPFARVDELEPNTLSRLLLTGRDLLRRNLSGGRRTTRQALSGPGLFVYGRAGAPCLVCGAHVERTAQGQPPRSTYYCPTCQADRSKTCAGPSMPT